MTKALQKLTKKPAPRKKTAPKPQNRQSTRIAKKAMLDAMHRACGLVSYAVKITKAKVSRDTHYRWYNTDAKYKAAIDSIEEDNLDFGEQKLRDRMEVGDTQAIIFYNKTKGKKRGYIENPNIINTNTLNSENTIMVGYGPEE